MELITSDKHGIELAFRQALFSPDPRTQVGAVILANDGQYIAACNDYPIGVYGDDYKISRKDDYIEHAETLAVLTAARLHIPTHRAAMYCTWAACPRCARAIIQSGIKRVVIYEKSLDEPSRWTQACIDGREMLEDAKVQIDYYQSGITAEPIMFHGVEWQP